MQIQQEYHIYSTRQEIHMGGFSILTSSNCSESLLTGSIPNLQFNTFSIKLNCPYLKVNTVKGLQVLVPVYEFTLRKGHVKYS